MSISSSAPRRLALGGAVASVLLAGACALTSGAGDLPHCVDGIYPHLAMFNGEGECGTGAVVPWAGSLWVVTYGPHLPAGSSDKLYQITPDLKQIVRPESVGGTHANRLIHRETNQLLIGPYVIDAKGRVRVVPPARMPGRLTGAARHLADPANKVYVATMETGLYELDMRTLAVRTLIRENGKNDGTIASLLKREKMPWPDGWNAAPQTKVPGYHSKGLSSGFGRVFISNNGEDSDAARRNLFVPSGVLADWSAPGQDWRMIRRCQFTEVTTPDGIYGNEHPKTNPVWSLGWDAKSVILAVTTNGTAWTYYRLAKGSHCYDGAHGWNTEWPRIRDVGFGDGTLLATMHGTFWKFPKDFSPARPNGIRPLSTYLKVIGDFCRWRDRIVFGCDDQAQNEFLGTRTLKKGAPKRDRSQSNLWFVKPEDLTTFGPPSGEGWVWLRENVKAGQVSDPFLCAGYEATDFTFTDAAGKAVRHELLHEGDWVRVKALEDAQGANAHFVLGPKRPATLPKVSGLVEVYDDHSKKTYCFPNVNGDKTVICREVATERDLLYAGGVFYEVPADNAGGFAALRPIALADEPVKSIEARLGLVFVNGRPMAVDSLWKNGTAAQAHWLWRESGRVKAPQPSARKTAVVVDNCHPEKSGFGSFVCASLARAGFAVVNLARTDTAETIAEKVRHADVVVFQGAAFSEHRSPRGKRNLYKAAGRLRHRFHYSVLGETVRQGKPLFGICFGLQRINAFLGGTRQPCSAVVTRKLDQPIAHHQKARGRHATHAVAITPGSRLARVLNRTELWVNSLHNFAASKVSPRLRVVATAPDGVVEAVEGIDYPAFAVQFHPEMRSSRDRASQAIFNNLMKLVDPNF